MNSQATVLSRLKNAWGTTFITNARIGAVVFGLLVSTLRADVSLPAIFGDDMVLQRDQLLRVWGQADPDERVAVTLASQGGYTQANQDGQWRIELPPLKAGGPYSLKVAGKNRIEFQGVMVGEVWICSGQSNMQWSLVQTQDGSQEAARANHPNLRLFTVTRQTSERPLSDVQGIWQPCTPESSGQFSAVGYYFGLKLRRELKVPVGLINSSWGGTRVEPWTDHITLQTVAGMEAQFNQLANAAAALKGDRSGIDQARAARQAALQQLLAMEADLAPAQVDPAFDVSSWSQMEIPKPWEQAGLPGYDGLVWFRKTVNIPSSWNGKDLHLHLGPVDEIDMTWFNGKRVGSTGSFKNSAISRWNEPRRYRIPSDLVKAGGRNVIAVRAIDTSRAGGLWGADPGQMMLLPVGAPVTQGVSIAGRWHYHAALRIPPAPQEILNPNLPTVLYNAMIHPLRTFALRGAIWYQGESNLRDGLAYTDKMRALIESWRWNWGQGDFPFYFVQLAPFRYGADSRALPLIWEAQSAVLALPRTGMAVITDLGNLTDIHPRRKREVGERLARWALARNYGHADLVYSGPRYRSMDVEGSRIRVHFHHAEQGLSSSDDKPLTWFEVAGSDGNYLAARAQIEGNTVVVWNDNIPRPVAVRFAWDQEAEPNLFNRADLPAGPFRSVQQ